MKSLTELINIELYEARDIISVGNILTLKVNIFWSKPDLVDEFVENGWMTSENSELLDDFIDLKNNSYLFLKNTKFEYVRKDENRYILKEVNSGAEIFVREPYIKDFIKKNCKK